MEGKSMSGKTPGQAAYEGYRAFSRGKSLISGQPIPEWDVLEDDLTAAWEAAATAGAAGAHERTAELVSDGILTAVKAASGDTIVIAFNHPVSARRAREVRECWAVYAPGTTIVLVDDVADIEAISNGGVGALVADVSALRDELDETRAAFAELAAHFGKGAQSGWTARISGTVLHRLCLAAKVPDPGAPVTAGTEHLAAELAEEGR
jgi:hypothetical protein